MVHPKRPSPDWEGRYLPRGKVCEWIVIVLAKAFMDRPQFPEAGTILAKQRVCGHRFHQKGKIQTHYCGQITCPRCTLRNKSKPWYEELTKEFMSVEPTQLYNIRLNRSDVFAKQVDQEFSFLRRHLQQTLFRSKDWTEGVARAEFASHVEPSIRHKGRYRSHFHGVLAATATFNPARLKAAWEKKYGANSIYLEPAETLGGTVGYAVNLKALIPFYQDMKEGRWLVSKKDFEVIVAALQGTRRRLPYKRANVQPSVLICKPGETDAPQIHDQRRRHVLGTTERHSEGEEGTEGDRPTPPRPSHVRPVVQEGNHSLASLVAQELWGSSADGPDDPDPTEQVQPDAKEKAGDP